MENGQQSQRTPVDPVKVVEKLTQQNAMMNQQLIMQSIALEELAARIKELEGGNARSSIESDAGTPRD